MGRITTEEHSERLEQIWAARTAADLAPAFADLPRPRVANRCRPHHALRARATGPPHACRSR